MNPVIVAYILLGIAIVSEVIGTVFLVKSEGFSKLGPTCAVIIFYVVSFYLLAQVTKTIPIGIAYAIWGGAGIVLTAIFGVLLFRQSLDWAAMLGIAMIIGGVLVINLLSSSVTH